MFPTTKTRVISFYFLLPLILSVCTTQINFIYCSYFNLMLFLFLVMVLFPYYIVSHLQAKILNVIFNSPKFCS